MLRFAVCGAGRIGRIHARNIAAHPGASLEYVIDVVESAAAEVAAFGGGRAAKSLAEALPHVDAVLIASPTPTHVELIEAAAAAGKAIFCEKPIDLDLARVDRTIEKVNAAGIPFFVGFNRRFDPSFARMKSDIVEGKIGTLEQLAIVSRDPGPPPVEYIRQSGGLFRDMSIHDFDMVRWILGEDPVEVYATASNFVDPAIEAAGDIDGAVVVLKARSGALIHITNSRRAVYGYDQRVEAFGSEGMLTVENQTDTRVVRWTDAGVSRDKPQPFFLERYMAAYQAELEHFVDAVGREDGALLVTAHDGRQALALADAALASLKSGQPVKI